MPRGRPRKHDPSIPAHIDQAKIPRGIYWDRTGKGRWYVLNVDDYGRTRAKTVAQSTARLSDLHAIAEERAGGPARGTVEHVIKQFESSLAFVALAESTKEHHRADAKAIIAYTTKQGPFGGLIVDRLSLPIMRRIIDVIAQGKPAEKSGDKAIPPYPTKANKWIRYLGRAFGWGMQFGHCTTNPARGLTRVAEKRDHRMPSLAVFRAVQAYARACSALGPRAKGHQPAYVWAAMELGYQARLRGIEVLTLTDAHDLDEDLQTNRRKGSRDNLVRKGSLMTTAIAELQQLRTEIWTRKKRPIPMRADQRPLFVGEDGDQLTRSGFHSAFGRMMRAAVRDGIITADQRFALHGLKHRGVTDTAGTRATKKDASGHVTDAMASLYDHDLPRVEPAADP